MSDHVFCPEPGCGWNLKYNAVGEKYCSHCDYTEATPLNDEAFERVWGLVDAMFNKQGGEQYGRG